MSVPASSSIKNGIAGLGRIATCGSSVKFEGCFNDVHYRDIVKEVLQCKPDISLYHVGPLQEAFITDIRHFLEDSGIDPSRFLYVGPVSDLRQFLIINEIDLYLQSFPAGGGTTAVEVQSMGVPVIYANPDSWNASLIGSRSLYASQELEWNSLSEISQIIRESLSSGVWQELSRAAIEKYTSCFHPDRGADFFEALEAVFS
jgi:hypothetical protein